MKTLMRTFLAVVLFAALGSSAVAQTRIATVDLSRVFTNYWKFKQADLGLQDHRAELAKTEKEWLDNWQKARDEYQRMEDAANDAAIAAEERNKRKLAAEEKLREIKNIEDDIVAFRRQATAGLEQRTLRVRDNLLAEIRTAVNARARNGGYNLVLDSAAQSADRTTIVLFSAAENDLTDTVISHLNAGAPVETPPTPPR